MLLSVARLGASVQETAYLLLGVAAVIAVLVGVRQHRPTKQGPWLWLAGGAAAFVVGQAVVAATTLPGEPIRFPSPGDGILISAYVLLIVGMASLLKSRSMQSDLAATLDALLIVGGLGSAIWILMLGPYVADPATAIPDRLLNSVYSFLDLGLAVMVARLAFTQGRKSKSYQLLAIGALLTVAGGVLITLSTTGQVDPGFAILAAATGFVCLGGAALHPSMVDVAHRPVTPVSNLSSIRLLGVGAATVVPPVLLLVEDLRGRPPLIPVAIVAWGALSAVGVGRLGELIWTSQRLVRRQKQLMSHGQSLVAATTSNEIHRVSIDAAAELLREHADGCVSLALGDLDELAVSFSTVVGPARTSGPVLGTELVSGPWLDQVRDRGETAVVVIEGSDASPTGRNGAGPWLLVAPLMGQSHLRGALVIELHEPPSTHEIEGLQSVATDLSLALATSEVTAQLHQQKSDRRFGLLAERGTDIVLLLDEQLGVAFASPSAERTLGIRVGDERSQLASRMPDDDRRLLRSLLSTAKGVSGSVGPTELRWNQDEGPGLWLEVTITDLTNEEELDGIVINAHDITERKALEESLRHQALHDSLTGLANRFMLHQRASHALMREGPTSATARNPVAVVLIDLDDFKTLNDSLGHAAGDRLLRLVARRISSVIRPSDTVARLGGDEFAILLESRTTREEVLSTARRVLGRFGHSFTLDGRSIDVGASIGVAFADADSTDGEILLRNADVAMYTAKQHEQGGIRVFEDEMHASILERMELRTDLAHAVRNNELTVAYQPVIRLPKAGPSQAADQLNLGPAGAADGVEIAGFEALLRWNHPTRGPISPMVFIPIAEETSLIGDLGRFVLDEAVRQIARWQRRFDRPDLFMCVNASVEQLQTLTFTNQVEAAIAAVALEPDRLTIEVTETVLADDLDNVAATLRSLSQLGVEIAIDDFGTGYASLSYLQALPLDKLKVDKSFVDQLEPGGDDRVLTSILDMASTLDLPVVAEGVETRHQAERLTGLDCTFAQGFHFARPAPAAQIAELLSGDLVPAT